MSGGKPLIQGGRCMYPKRGKDRPSPMGGEPRAVKKSWTASEKDGGYHKIHYWAQLETKSHTPKELDQHNFLRLLRGWSRGSTFYKRPRPAADGT